MAESASTDISAVESAESGEVQNAAESPQEKSPRGLRRFALRHPRVSAWIVFVLVLGLWGAWAGPGWNPQPMRTMIVPETDDTAITTLSPSAELGTYQVNESVVHITLRDGTEIPATLRVPVGVEGLQPGMVFIHGTGTDSYQSFSEEASDITSTGIVTLVPEKRTEDYTTTHRDYPALAKDYADVFTYLVKDVPGVDPRRSGLYGVSEGCFVAPIVATSRDDVSFVALVSAPVLPIREQGALAADTYLRKLGAPDRIIRIIPRLIGQNFGEGTFDYIDFDVSSYQRDMTMPVLMLYGTGDMSMPTVQGPLIMQKDLAKAGNSDLTVRYYKGADHGLKVDHVLSKVAMQDTADWVNGLPFTADAAPHIAGAQPSQDHQAGAVDRPHWFASGPFALWILFVGLAITLLSVVIIVANMVRWKGRQLLDLRDCGAKMSAAAIGIVVAWVACFGYIVAIASLALSYRQNPFIVQGGWLAAQCVAMVAVWLVVRTLFAWDESRRPTEDQAAMTLPANIFICVSLLGQITLLFALAYWGFYPSIL